LKLLAIQKQRYLLTYSGSRLIFSTQTKIIKHALFQQAAYDATLKAKERARLRTRAYDSKRKKFKEG
jgi:hypothetical protein